MRSAPKDVRAGMTTEGSREEVYGDVREVRGRQAGKLVGVAMELETQGCGLQSATALLGGVEATKDERQVQAFRVK